MKKIVFTGGGTLGHVMPNLTLIEEFDKNEVAYIGSNGIEKDRIKGVVDFYEIPAVKLVRGKVFENLKIPFVLFNAVRKSKKILKELNPKVVFSKGGYVSLPVCIAARKLKIPIIAHESDYSFGLANKLILKLCNVMCVNFKNLANGNDKIKYTGPIFPKSFESNVVKNSFMLDKNKLTMLIVGGSLGSKKINEIVFDNIEKLKEDFNIIHITGKGNQKIKSKENYVSIEMCNDMNNLYNLSDFVVGRSGAGVTAECFYKKLPMILIPLENGSSRGDQKQNAEYYKNLKVAKIIYENELTSEKFLFEIFRLKKEIDIFKNNYNKFNQYNGKNKIINLLKSYIN